MKTMRVARIAAIAASVVVGATGVVGAQRSIGAETTRQGPTPAEISQVRAAIAEYRKLWATDFDAESRALARQYGAPTPDELERMFNEWMAGSISVMPELPTGVPGKLSDAFKMMPNKTPAKPGEELPDFATPPAKETFDSLKDAKTSHDEVRDKHAEAASCSPEALAAKKALQDKLDAYRKALTDMDAARADVEREKGAGAALERASLVGGALGVVKSTADAAMELFGVAATFLPTPMQKQAEALGAAYNVAGGTVSALTAAGPTPTPAEGQTAAGLRSDANLTAASGLITAQSNILKLQAMTVGGSGASLLNGVATAGETVSRVLDTTVLNSSQQQSDTATSRAVETVGNVMQLSGTVKSTLADALPGAPPALGVTGQVFSGVGTVASTTARYSRGLDEAFGQILGGQDERRNLDSLNSSTLRQIDSKRLEFMQKIAALEAEIGRTNCAK